MSTLLYDRRRYRIFFLELLLKGWLAGHIRSMILNCVNGGIAIMTNSKEQGIPYAINNTLQYCVIISSSVLLLLVSLASTLLPKDTCILYRYYMKNIHISCECFVSWFFLSMNLSWYKKKAKSGNQPTYPCVWHLVLLFVCCKQNSERLHRLNLDTSIHNFFALLNIDLCMWFLVIGLIKPQTLAKRISQGLFWLLPGNW